MFRAAAIIAAAVLALAGLWAARAVMMPVAFGWLIIALVWPVQRRLRAKLPQVIAVLVTTAVALLAIVAGGWLVVWAFGDIPQWVIANAARLQGLYMHAAELLERRGLYAAELFAEQVNVLWLVQVLRAIGGAQLQHRDLRFRHIGAVGGGAGRTPSSPDWQRAIRRGRDRLGD
jgi:AI-2 transport protein TqsA